MFRLTQALFFAVVLLTGCSGAQYRDISTDAAPAAFVSSRTIHARAVIAAHSTVHVLPKEPDPWLEDRSRLAAARAAAECASLLRTSGAFDDAVPRELALEPGPSDVELVLTEEILAAPRFEVGLRRGVVGVLYLALLFPLAIPLDAIYVERRPGVEARYTLEVRDAHGDAAASFETLSSIQIEEQACAGERDDVRPWLVHAPALRLARERAIRALISKLGASPESINIRPVPGGAR